MAWFVAGTMTAVSAYGAISGAKSANAAATNAANAANRKYALESGVAEDQMDEQNQLAVEKMTDVTRQFLVAKGKANVINAEAMTTGVSNARIDAVNKTKKSEAKGQVAKEINTNITNIAQGMIANKIETEGMVADANASRKNIYTETLVGGLQGFTSGYMLGSAIDSRGTPTKENSVGASQAGVTNTGIYGRVGGNSGIGG